MNCGSDLEQHINGKITLYLPILISVRGPPNIFVKDWIG